MKQAIASILIVLCGFSVATAQTSKQCHAQLLNLSLPKLALTDYDIAPLEFLFSENGQDFYSATSYHRADPLKWIEDNGLTVIDVYSSTTMRLKIAQYLRKSNIGAFRAGFPQDFENVKYSMINFFGPAASFVRDIEYFQPKACVSSYENQIARLTWMDYWDFRIWGIPGLHASRNEPNWITGFLSPGMTVSARSNPMYVKIHNVMSEHLGKYLASETATDGRGLKR